MERLQLETETYPNPYAIGWIKEVGGIRVHECCKVSFSIGKCNDEVYCEPKALQAEGRNFLTFVHDPSSLMET